jgi:hypothetical protein
MLQVQAAQEYTGQQIHAMGLANMWEWYLQFDTRWDEGRDEERGGGSHTAVQDGPAAKAEAAEAAGKGKGKGVAAAGAAAAEAAGMGMGVPRTGQEHGQRQWQWQGSGGKQGPTVAQLISAPGSVSVPGTINNIFNGLMGYYLMGIYQQLTSHCFLISAL